MMTFARVTAALSLFPIFSGGSVRATDIGDPAPAIKIAEWVKGDAVTIGKGKNVYVLEFWATWCGPCRASIPHLTELQAKYKGKSVVLVSITDEPTAIVKPFVEKQGERMAYTVACDDGRATGEAYLKPFEIDGIPHAFIIDKAGKLAWHGYPLDPDMEKALELVVAGKHDIEATRKAIHARDDGMRAVRKKSQEALKVVKEYFAAVDTDPTRADEIAGKILSHPDTNAMVLNVLAWGILTNDGIQNRNLDLAMKVAKAAYDACEGKDAAIVDTYARALFDTGKIDEAIKHQKAAVELCKDEGLRPELEEALKRYLNSRQ
jgi:thiol-disulfide isomerase/thioredoxin